MRKDSNEFSELNAFAFLFLVTFLPMCVFCSDTESRKLCKKMKVDPNSKEKGVDLLHYK